MSSERHYTHCPDYPVKSVTVDFFVVPHTHNSDFTVVPILPEGVPLLDDNDNKPVVDEKRVEQERLWKSIQDAARRG